MFKKGSILMKIWVIFEKKLKFFFEKKYKNLQKEQEVFNPKTNEKEIRRKLKWGFVHIDLIKEKFWRDNEHLLDFRK